MTRRQPNEAAVTGPTKIAIVGLLACLPGCGVNSDPPDSGQVKPLVSQDSRQDLLVAADFWWGLKVDEFLRLAELGPQDYSQRSHPTNPEIQVILPKHPVGGSRWEPQELPPLSFEFSSAKGLYEIGGFHKGKKPEILRTLERRYGAHTRSVEVIGIRTYAWEFSRTILEVSDAIFRIYPRG